MLAGWPVARDQRLRQLPLHMNDLATVLLERIEVGAGGAQRLPVGDEPGDPVAEPLDDVGGAVQLSPSHRFSVA